MATLTRTSFTHVLNDIRLVNKPAAVLWVVAIAGLISLIALLTIAISDGAVPSQDRTVLDWVVDRDAPLVAGISELVSALTRGREGTAASAAAILFLWLLGMRRAALAFAFIGVAIGGVAYGADFTIGEIVGRSRPLDTSSDSSYPSGHVFASTVLFGFWSFLAVYYRLKKKFLIPLLSVLLLLILAVGFSRIFEQAHWPSDVAAAYLLGAFWLLLLIPFFIYFQRVTWLSSPKQASELAILECDSCRIASSIASTVVLNPEEGTATKIYKPPGLVKLLYWVAFQAKFPYEHNRAALDAATYRRKIGSALTIHRFGKDLVAHVSAVNCMVGPCEFVTDLIPGAEAENDEATREFLGQLTETFAEAGLSVWQINPRNPHAHTNVIYNTAGDPIIVDLESAVVTPIPAPGQWRSAMRRGNIPIFDDIDFETLRHYIATNEVALEASLGIARLAEFKDDVDLAEQAIRTWQESEPRIWGRLIRGAYRLFDWKRHFGFASHIMENSDKAAEQYLNRGIDRWESEGRLTPSETASLRSQISSGDARSALHHMGAHLVLSMIAVPIPGVRSVARFGWTLSFWVKIQLGRFRRGAPKAAGKVTNIHSPLVMVLALVPLLGGIAYMAARPLRRKLLIRLMLDQVAIKLPLKFYTRLRLNRLLAPSRG